MQQAVSNLAHDLLSGFAPDTGVVHDSYLDSGLHCTSHAARRHEVLYSTVPINVHAVRCVRGATLRLTSADPETLNDTRAKLGVGRPRGL